MTWCRHQRNVTTRRLMYVMCRKQMKAQEIIEEKKKNKKYFFIPGVRIVEHLKRTRVSIQRNLNSLQCFMYDRVGESCCPLRQGAVAAQSSCSQGHVVLRGRQLSLHHAGHQPPRRVHHTCRDQPSRETQCHEPSFLEASICL